MWLPLAEYSIKHNVSISTLRRRIKAEDIQYKLENGKYLIFDEAAINQPAADFNRSVVLNNNLNKGIQIESSGQHRPSLMSEPNLSYALERDSNHSSAEVNFSDKTPIHKIEKNEGESVITAANRLLADLKKAYTQVLHEKEEQILGLKEEISDLRTLVKVLESENSRLSGHQVNFRGPVKKDFNENSI